MSDNTPDTLGLEFESIISTTSAMCAKYGLALTRHPYIKSAVRDASVESEASSVGAASKLFLGNSHLRDKLKMDKGNVVVSGYEIVTHPLSLTDMRKAIADIINIQVKMGEIYSDRTSIHVHTGFPTGLIFAKVAVALGLRVEPLLYKIAGMGREFRGSNNNSTYCRPLVMGPAVRLTDSSKIVQLDAESALITAGPAAFWGRFGGIHMEDVERYNPVRYIGINIYSTLLRGTMEYRHFNYSNNGRYVGAVAALCQFISDLMTRVSINTALDSIEKVSIFEKNPTSSYHGIMDDLLKLGSYYNCKVHLEERDVSTIAELIEITPQPVFVKKPILSHIKRGRISLSEAMFFGLKLVTDAQEPNFVDIHNFNSSDRKLLGE